MERASTRRPRPGWIRVGVLGAAVVLLGGLACGDDSTGPAPPPPPAVTTVTVSPASAELSAIGETVRLSADVRDQNGRAMPGAAVSWGSSDAAVATVDSSGLVTAEGPGAATVTATSGGAGAFGSAAVTVTQSADSVTVSPAAATIGPGETLRLAAEALDANGHPVTKFAWSSDDPTVASVDDSGLVRGVGEGTTTVVATAGDARGISEITVADPDRAVLVALYEATDGPSWIDSENWLTDAPLGAWHGVETDRSGRVVLLWLGWNGLSGAIPPELGLLTNLTELHLGGNELTGGIPPELGGLANLTSLWLDWNGLSGAIPPELGLLTNLTELQLWGNELTGGIPPELGGLANLTSLWLHWNDLSGAIPPELGRLANLTELKIGRNDLSGPIPPELGGLANLRRLWLEENDLSGAIPPELGGLANLTELVLHANDLSGPIPPELGRLANLQLLFLFYNDLSGQIPPELAGLANLRELNLLGNELTGGIPPELADLANLTELGLTGNELTGGIPPELGRLVNLRSLLLSTNDLSGPIPPELGRLANLMALWLGENDLSGPIPPELGRLANLTSLGLGTNDLSGPIPPELGGLANLNSLTLKRNDLSGPIPPELGGLANLRHLSLFQNELTGGIPPELGGLANLKTLWLLWNDLSGPIPPELGRLASLEVLDLGNNAAMSGALPASLTELHNLKTLDARGTGLCVPNDDAGLRAWLSGVPDAQVAACSPAAAYLVQAVQSREWPVPLVAGEDALLRVFVTAARESDAGIPLVRARFHLNGTETHAVDIPGTAAPIPTEIDEGDMSKSANAVIPGAVVRPGLEVVIEVDPDGTLDPGLGVAERIPATGRLAVEVREMPLFDLTVIPFLWAAGPDSSVIGIAEGMAADPEGHELLQATQTLLPVADIEVTAHAPVTSSSRSGYAVLGETEAIRVLEGGTGHYMGLKAGFSDFAGVAEARGWSSASVPSWWVIAQMFGANMSLRHAPCGNVGAPDPRYPYPGGSIGSWGYDFPGEFDLRVGGAGPVSPVAKDLMGECSPVWISDYHFSKALRYRLINEGAPAAATRSILVWGGVDADGALFLEPAFVVDAPPTLPDSSGEYQVIGRTAGGGELFSLSFAMPELADADGASAFVFVVPAEPGWEGALASLTLSGPDGETMLDRDTDRPMVILRDPGTGQVRAFLRDLPPEVLARPDLAAALSSEPGLEALFSRGIPDAAAWRR